MRVITVPVLKDNYSYLLVDSNTELACAIDPAEPEKLLCAAKAEGITISHCLTTHHHWDHAGGNIKLGTLLPGLTVIGGLNENVPGCTQTVSHAEVLNIGTLRITCLETPYHTLGHMCFLCEEEGSAERVIFTGDSLFVGGSGRCFVGTYEQMYHSLVDVIGSLPPTTKVYCGHEYTVSNLTFCHQQDKDNVAVLDKLEWARVQRQQGLPTVPSTIGEELTYNVFLRCREPALADLTKGSTPVEVLQILRERKDNCTFGAAAVSAALGLVKAVPPLAKWAGVNR